MFLPISAIILTHRADKRFFKALHSVKNCAEIIILDHQSGLKKSDLNDNPHLKIIPLIDKKIADFAQTRNQIFKKCQYDWLFFLDSDEYLEINDEEFLKAIHDPEIKAFQFLRVDIFHEHKLTHGELKNQFFSRLFNRNYASFDRPVHETVKVDGKSKKLSTIIYHEAHQDLSEFMRKIDYYTDIEANFRLPKVNQAKVILELVLYPVFKFLNNYFCKFGFLDGFPGLVYTIMMSWHSLVLRIKLLELILKNEEKI